MLAGQTVTQDFALAAAPVVLRDIEVQVGNLLVPRDEVVTTQRVQGDFLEHLPVDRLNDLLALQPGVVASGRDGPLALSIRGGRADEAVTYVDGVPVTPGYRGLGLGTPGTQISVGTNAVQEASITTGAASAEYGDAQSGVISLVTRTGGSSFHGALSYQTDEPFGVRPRPGLQSHRGEPRRPASRVISPGFWPARSKASSPPHPAAVAKRRRSSSPAGVDTTVMIVSDTTTTADTSSVPVYRFAVSRGNCDEFRRSANPGIRDNYGLPCQGIRTPSSPSSLYELAGKLGYSFGNGSRIGLSYLRSQNQERTFDYANLYDAPALSGARRWSQVLTLNWTQNLIRTTERALALELYLSYQRDQSIGGPLTGGSELATRAPFGGFMIKPLGFLFDFDNFPLNRGLVENVRQNRPGTRRTPLDAESPGQYNTVDQYRNDAYGLLGWSERGDRSGHWSSTGRAGTSAGQTWTGRRTAIAG